MIKILTTISIWYVFYFMLTALFLINGRDKVLPSFYSRRFDFFGNNIYTFMPSFIFLVWNYVV